MLSAERARTREDAAASSVKPSDLLADFMERLAICLEAGDIPQDVADRVASDQCDSTLDALVARQVVCWCDRVRTMRDPADDCLAELKPACLATLREQWVIDAVRLGWDETSLLGLDPTAPDGQAGDGLIVRIALAGFGASPRVIHLDPSKASISMGASRNALHFNAHDKGPMIWEHPAFRLVH